MSIELEHGAPECHALKRKAIFLPRFLADNGEALPVVACRPGHYTEWNSRRARLESVSGIAGTALVEFSRNWRTETTRTHVPAYKAQILSTMRAPMTGPRATRIVRLALRGPRFGIYLLHQQGRADLTTVRRLLFTPPPPPGVAFGRRGLRGSNGRRKSVTLKRTQTLVEDGQPLILGGQSRQLRR